MYTSTHLSRSSIATDCKRDGCWTISLENELFSFPRSKSNTERGVKFRQSSHRLENWAEIKKCCVTTLN